MDKPARLPPDTARGVVRRCDGLGQPDAAFGAVGELALGCATGISSDLTESYQEASKPLRHRRPLVRRLVLVGGGRAARPVSGAGRCCSPMRALTISIAPVRSGSPAAAVGLALGSWPRSRGIDAELDPGSQWWPTAQLLEGICSLLADETDRADPNPDPRRRGRHRSPGPARGRDRPGRTLPGGHGPADWKHAATLAEQAADVVRTGGLDSYVASALVHAALARVAVHQGDVPRAQSNSRGPLGCGPCSPTPCRTWLSRRCWSWAGSAWPWTTPPASGWCCAKPARSSGCAPTSASSPPRSTSCGPSSTPAAGLSESRR